MHGIVTKTLLVYTFQQKSWCVFYYLFLIGPKLLTYVFIGFDVVRHDTFATLKWFQVKVPFTIKKKSFIPIALRLQ
jgi:hypothetical protein